MDSAKRNLSRRRFLRLAGSAAGIAALGACATPTPQVIKETVVQTVEVEKKVVETQVVEKPVEKVVEKVITATPAPKEPLKLRHIESWFARPASVEVAQPVMKAISEKAQSEGLNIELDIIILDDHQNKYPVLYATGEDFTSAFDAPWYRMPSLREQSYIVPTETYFDTLMPKVKELITQQILDANYEKGHIWGLPIGYYYGTTYGIVVREDLRKKFGVPEPGIDIMSFEPFMQACQDGLGADFMGLPCFKHQQASISGGLGWKDNGWKYPGGSEFWIWGLIMQDVKKNPVWDEEEAVPVKKDMFDVQRKWYEKGWVTREELNLEMGRTHEQVFYPGKAVMNFSSEPDYTYYTDQVQIQKNIPTAECRGYDLSQRRAGKVKGFGTLRQWNYVVFNAMAAGDKRTANMQYWNWVYSHPDNIDLWLFGIDGVNYKKEEGLRYSEVEGVDPNRNYRHEWYTGGVPGKYRRIHKDLPKEAEEALKFMSTAENWDFSDPLVNWVPDTKPIENEMMALTAAFPEAAFAINMGSTDWETAKKKFQETLDAAGRQKVKAELNRQVEAYLKENPPA